MLCVEVYGLWGRSCFSWMGLWGVCWRRWGKYLWWGVCGEVICGGVMRVVWVWSGMWSFEGKKEFCVELCGSFG